MTNSEQVLPPFNRPGGPAEPRALRTPLIDQLREDPDSIDAAAVTQRLVEALLAGCGHEYVPFAGQSVGLIHDILPAAEILRRVVTETEAALSTASRSIIPA